MGYAFDGVPWHELPDSERLSICVMNAIIRDHSLNHDEQWAKHLALSEMREGK